MDVETTETAAEQPAPHPAKPRRGFAAMSPEKQRAIAARGGKAAHARGTAHEFDANEAREAGRRGGYAVAKDRAYMASIGREGARKSALVRKQRAAERRAARAAEEARAAEGP